MFGGLHWPKRKKLKKPKKLKKILVKMIKLNLKLLELYL
jgi:hypothetical protein